MKLADGVLTIKGEKQEEKEEKKKGYYLSERSFGSFQRSFQVPNGVCCRLNRSTQHFILDGKMECIQ